MTRFLSVGLVFSLALMLGGCGESVELHRQLSEQDANEVIAELADKHIRAQKVPAKDGVVVRVNAADISRAVRTLEAVGLPKVARATMGTPSARRASSLRHWKSVPGISMPCPRSWRRPCQTSMGSSSLVCTWCCPNAWLPVSPSNPPPPPCSSNMTHDWSPTASARAYAGWYPVVFPA